MGPSSNPGAVGSDTDPCGEAWVKFYDEEKFTSVWTGNAIPETQILRVRSTQEQEVLVRIFKTSGVILYSLDSRDFFRN